MANLATLEPMYVKVDGLRVRTSPTTKAESKVVGKLKRGQKIHIVLEGIKDVKMPDGVVWEMPTPYTKEMSKTNVEWVYVAKPIKGWAASAVGQHVYLQEDPIKTSSKKPPKPNITPKDIVFQANAGSGGASKTATIVLVLALGGLAAWMLANRTKKRK